MQNQKCPLCDSEAKYVQVDSSEGKLFSCHKCVKFCIDLSSESYLQQIPEVARTEIRDNLSVLASNSKKDELFVIREPRNVEIHGSGHGTARERMITEWRRSV